MFRGRVRGLEWARGLETSLTSRGARFETSQPNPNLAYFSYCFCWSESCCEVCEVCGFVSRDRLEIGFGVAVLDPVLADVVVRVGDAA